MGIDVTIYLRTERHQVPAVFAGLVERVTLKLTAFSAALLTQSWHHRQELTADVLVDHLPTLLAELVPSHRRLEIYGVYELASGQQLDGLTLYCAGEAYEDGWNIRRDGYVFARFEAQYLGSHRHQPVSVSTHPALSGRVLTDTEELFFRCAGVGGDYAGDPAIQQVVLERETVTAPVSCALVYQQQPAQFVQDLVSSYVRYRRGMPLPEQAGRTPDTWDVGRSPLDGPPPRQPLRTIRTEEKIKTTLLTALDDDRVRRLATLPDSMALPLVHAVAQTVAGIHWYDFGARGAIVSTGHPARWLWPFYRALLERVQPYLEA